jgi:hypothetical protein
MRKLDFSRTEFGKKEWDMKTQGRCDPRTLSGSCKRVTISTLASCTLLLGGLAFSQTVNWQAGAEIVAQNVGGSAAESSSQPNQAQTSLPDAPSASQRASSNGGSLTLGERFSIYGHALTRPYTVVGPALGAGIGQWEDEPPEWGQGVEGYARRFGSGMGRHFIAETIRFGFAAADGEDPRYQRSDETGVWDRARHAIVETFTSQTSSGTRIPAFSRFAGVYGAAFISNTWYPDSRATTGYALRRGSTALGSSLGFHLFEEFIWRKEFKALHIQD